MPARSNDRTHFRDNTESANGQQPEFSNAHPTPAPVRVEMQRDGTLMVKGDPAQLQERLRQGGVDRVLRRKGGVLVGLDKVHKARQLLSNPQPTQDRSRTAPPTSALTRRKVATSQGDFVAESHGNGYIDANGRAQEPTQPDGGRGPTTGRSRATSLDSVRGTGDAVPPRTASLVGLGISERVELAGSQALVSKRVDSPEQLCLPAVQRLRP